MIICQSWLQEWVNPDWDTETLVEKLTMAGLEVDGVSPVARKFSGLVVGEVESVEQHPDADKLSLCQVSDGKQSYQVVCGAPNVRAGMRVPFAQIGAEIIAETGEKPFKIKAAKLRGVESNGMLCSAEELGLEEKSEGLLELAGDAPVGADIREYLNLDDSSIELDLTPNRGDCLSVRGVAREVGVLARKPVQPPPESVVEATINDEFPIKITAADECPRYLGRVIRNINQNVTAPLWMQEKLRRSGLRSIDPIVDVTNYVLMELGQPMHAFDYNKLEGHIDVRLAQPEEKITLLDGKEVTLSEDTLVIADAEKAVAMAGIMGGLATSVTKETKDVFLECAFFAPLAIAGKARGYGMHTDASHRYERGVDHSLQQQAMERATELLLEIVGGEAGPITEAIGNLPAQTQVSLRFPSIARQLGVEISNEEVLEIFERLGFGIADQNDSQVTVDVPSFRFDVTIEADLIEELARIYGYNNIPLGQGWGAQTFAQPKEQELEISRIRDQLVALGYQEVISYSFIDPTLSEIVSEPDIEPIRLKNPISEDMAVMRSSLIPGLLHTVQYNANRQQGRIRLFESGLVFSRVEGEIHQVDHIAGAVMGSRNPKNWSNNNDLSDFFDVKGDVELLADLGRLGRGLQFVEAEKKPFHPGQCARIQRSDGTEIGVMGALHPAVQRELGLDQPVLLFELDLESLKQAQIPAAHALSRYPEVHRDLAVVLDESVSAGQISALIHEKAGEFLSDFRIFDVYQGDAVQKGKKSVALGLTWQHPSRTLSDDEVNAIISSCVNALQEQFNANLRN